MKCDWAERIMTLAAYGEAEDAERHEWERHVAECAACAERLRELETLRSGLPPRAEAESDAAQLHAYRRRLSAALAGEPRPSAAAARWGWLGLGLGARWELKPALAAMLVIAGFCAGWLTHPAVFAGSGPGAGGATQASMFGADQPPVRVDAVEPAGSGQVRVIFDALQRRTVAGSPASPAMQQLLLFAAQHPMNLGVRLDTLEALKPSAADSDVRSTLVQALRQDPNPGVRLKALDALAPLVREDGDVRQALLQSVLHDANAGVRAEAISALSQAPPPDAAALLQEISSQTQDIYVRLRCAGLLRQIDAAAPGNLPDSRFVQPAPSLPRPEEQ